MNVRMLLVSINCIVLLCTLNTVKAWQSNATGLIIHIAAIL